MAARAVTVHPVDAQQRRHQPANGRQEHEGDIGLELGARVARVDGDARPVKDVAARAVEPVDEQAESDKPQDRNQEVGRPVDEAAGEGEQPDD